jgi:hypothetical protein
MTYLIAFIIFALIIGFCWLLVHLMLEYEWLIWVICGGPILLFLIGIYMVIHEMIKGVF